MAVLSPTQIAQYASRAGFVSVGLTMAVAIALAESGGNPNASHGNTNGSIDRGLWQINSVHTQFNALALYDPLYNAKAAYAISGGGSNWNPWSTYKNGSYRLFLTRASQATVGSGNTQGSSSMKPWYTYPRIDNFGQIDPQGNYWKPDSNILTPPGYPVTALLPGMVSSVQRTGFGQTVVTIKLLTPINSLATHTFYEHMHDSTVSTGQRVNAGDLIGHANYSGEGAALGFGLYSGDIYGSGPAWNILQNDLRPGGAGLLNPVSLLNSAAAGHLTIPSGGGGGLTGGTGGLGTVLQKTYTPLSQMTHETLINTPGFYGIALALDEAEQFPGWVDLTAPQQDISIAGQDTGFAPPDVVGTIRSIGATISDNFIPFAIRSGLVSMGLVLLIALLIKAAAEPVKTLAPIVAAAA